MKCLDSDLLVAILRGKQEARAIVDEIDKEGKGATTSVNAFEIYFGANKSQRKHENLKETSRLLERLEVFSHCCRTGLNGHRIFSNGDELNLHLNLHVLVLSS